MDTKDKIGMSAVLLMLLAIVVGCGLCSCSATAGAGAKLPMNIGFDAETGVTIGVTGPLTGNEYQAAVPVRIPAGLPITVKRPKTLEK